jgi:hypothetical protein
MKKLGHLLLFTIQIFVCFFFFSFVNLKKRKGKLEKSTTEINLTMVGICPGKTDWPAGAMPI